MYQRYIGTPLLGVQSSLTTFEEQAHEAAGQQSATTGGVMRDDMDGLINCQCLL